MTFTREFPGDYGTKLLTKGHDDDGNLLVWWSSGEWLEQGQTLRAGRHGQGATAPTSTAVARR